MKRVREGGQTHFCFFKLVQPLALATAELCWAVSQLILDLQPGWKIIDLFSFLDHCDGNPSEQQQHQLGLETRAKQWNSLDILLPCRTAQFQDHHLHYWGQKLLLDPPFLCRVHAERCFVSHNTQGSPLVTSATQRSLVIHLRSTLKQVSNCRIRFNHNRPELMVLYHAVLVWSLFRHCAFAAVS